jgi:hypothetical protein
MMAAEDIELAKLVEDFTLYPRNNVDSTHVADLVTALRAGEHVPPIIAEKKTLRVVDGFHRRRALIRVLGDTATVAVELRRYKSDTELFMDAVTLNARHGRKLDRHDQARIVLRLREMKVEDKMIAVTLHVPEPIVQTLAVRVVYSKEGLAIPSKRGLKHLQGQKLTATQVQVIGSVRSAEVGRLCMELSGLLRENLVDLSNDTIVEQLRNLAEQIDSVLKSLAA